MEHDPDGAGRRSAVPDADEVARMLRDRRDVAPAEVSQRALGRIRLERGSWLPARTLGGALLRVGRAVPDYAGLAGASAAGEGPDEDTGEWPAPDVTPPA